MIYQNILKIIPGLQSISLVAKNLPKNFSMKPDKKMGMKDSKSLIKRGVQTLVGIALIKPTAQIINKL